MPVETPIKVTIGGKDFPCRWQVVRITGSIEESETFLGEPPKYLEERAKKKGK